MPVYTYRCENCGHQFDQYQKFTDQPLVRCPNCEKKTLRKVYSAVGIVFKGSGFYATDNRSPSGQSRSAGSKGGEAEKSGDGASDTSSSSDTAKTESKKEEKAPSSSPAAGSGPAKD